MQNDVYGIGNVLMDILVQTDYSVVKEVGLDHGTMNLVSSESIEVIEKAIKEREKKLVPGGSVPNSMAAVTALGGTAALVGVVSHNDYGNSFVNKIVEEGIVNHIQRTEGMTGRVVSLITPDSERTMATFLGISPNFQKHHIDEQSLKNSKIMHFTGYEFESQPDTILYALGLAKEHGIKVSMDVADPNLVERNKEKLLSLIKDHVDILFANEIEAKVLTGKSPELAVMELGSLADIAIVKVGKEGSMISDFGAIIMVEGITANAIDTTGAGDMYAGAFLFGLARGKDVETAGKIASIAAAKVVEHIGSRVPYSLQDVAEIKELI